MGNSSSSVGWWMVDNGGYSGIGDNFVNWPKSGETYFVRISVKRHQQNTPQPYHLLHDHPLMKKQKQGVDLTWQMTLGIRHYPWHSSQWRFYRWQLGPLPGRLRQQPAGCWSDLWSPQVPLIIYTVPEKWWLEDEISLWDGRFSGANCWFQGGYIKWLSLKIGGQKSVSFLKRVFHYVHPGSMENSGNINTWHVTKKSASMCQWCLSWHGYWHIANWCWWIPPFNHRMFREFSHYLATLSMLMRENTHVYII